MGADIWFHSCPKILRGHARLLGFAKMQLLDTSGDVLFNTDVPIAFSQAAQ